jgi:hypothetical protein
MEEFIKIFNGLERNYGYIKDISSAKNNEEGKLKTVYTWAKTEITNQDYINHLNGVKSIGIQPCDDEGMASFGAIDIDDKEHSYKNFPYQKYLEIIAKHKLPIVPVKSKSGGLHLYIFFSEKVKATFVRDCLENFLYCLDLKPGIEIYPKQTELGKDSSGKLIDGQFINLPYFNKTDRVALNLDGTEFSFEQFIEVVKANTFTQKQFEEFSLAHVKNLLQGGAEDLIDGPPCLQILTQNKLKDGRDRVLYNYMVFAKKKYKDNWEKKVLEFARTNFIYDNDWGDKKVEFKIKAWDKETTKGHTCTEDPIHAVCLKAECRKRAFGYLSDKQVHYPVLSGLVKIAYPEPEYTFNVVLPDGETTKQVRAKNIKQIINQDEIRGIIGNAAGFVPAKIKADKFQEVLDSLFPPKEVTTPAKGTTPEELLEEHLIEYVNGPQATTYAAFRTGATLVEEDKMFFKYKNFFDSLRNKDWKENKSKTGEMMMRLFSAKFGINKRFPKKDGEESSHPSVEVVEITIDNYIEGNIPTEKVPFKNTKEIF